MLTVNNLTIPNETFIAILDYLEPQDLENVQKVTKNWQGAAEGRMIKFAQKIGIYDATSKQNYFEATQNYLKQLISKVEAVENCPDELKALAEKIKLRICFAEVEDIKRLKAGVQALDTLVIWKVLAATANANRPGLVQRGINVPQANLVAPNFTNLTTLEELAETEIDFIDWFNKNKSELNYLQKLNLNKLNISFLPKELSKLIYLRELLLESNCLTALPKEFSSLVNLRYLAISNNKITSLSRKIISIPGLKIKCDAHHLRFSNRAELALFKCRNLLNENKFNLAAVGIGCTASYLTILGISNYSESGIELLISLYEMLFFAHLGEVFSMYAL